MPVVIRAGYKEITVACFIVDPSGYSYKLLEGYKLYADTKWIISNTIWYIYNLFILELDWDDSDLLESNKIEYLCFLNFNKWIFDHGYVSNKYLFSFYIALYLCDIRFFYYAFISAYVKLCPSDWNIESHPKPLLPLGLTIVPFVLPVNTFG